MSRSGLGRADAGYRHVMTTHDPKPTDVTPDEAEVLTTPATPGAEALPTEADESDHGD